MQATSFSARPFWSVMIPTYKPNHEYLVATLRSVLVQDPGETQMQIEIIDDASPGNEFIQAVKNLAGDRIQISLQPKNLGLAGIWNRCIERAKGEWIHILHQDDLVYPGFYARLQTGVKTYAEVGAAFSRHAYCDGNGHWLGLSPLEMSSPGILPDFVEPLVSGHHIQCASIAVKRSAYEQLGGFNAELKHALDWEMWIRIAQAFPLFYEPEILAAWRTHDEATTSSQMKSGENIRDIIRAIDVWKNYFPTDEGRRLSRLALKRFAHEALSGAKHFLTLKNFRASRVQILAALQCDRSFAVLKPALRIYMENVIRSIMALFVRCKS